MVETKEKKSGSKEELLLEIQELKNKLEASERRLKEIAEESKKQAAELELAEKSLVQNESEYHAYFDSPGAMRGVVDVIAEDDLRYVVVNPATAASLGLAPEAMINRRGSELGRPRDLMRLWICRFYESRESGIPVTFEYMDDREGRDSWHYAMISYLGIAPDGCPRFSFVLFDITRRKKLENELNETTDYLTKLINYANAPIIVWEPSRKISRFNHAFETLTGYRSDEVIGKDLEMLFPESSRQGSLEKIGDTLDGEHWESVEIPILSKNGEIRIVLWNSANIFSKDLSEIVSTIAQGQDITERKRAEEELRQSRKDMDHAQEVGQIGSWRMDVRRNVLTWSDENHRIFGVPKGTPMTYETFLETIHPEDRPFVDAKWKAALEGAPYDIEHRIRIGEQVKWLREKAYLEFDDAGILMGGFGISQDITNRKNAESQVEKLQEEQRIILDSVPALIFYKDRENRFINVNKAFADAMEMPKEQLEGMSLFDLYPEKQAKAFWEDDKEVLASGIPKRDIIEPMDTGKGLLWVKTDKVPYRDSRGEIAGIIGFSLDITERKMAEDALQKLNEQLEQRVEERTLEVGRERKRLYEVLETLPAMIGLLTPDHRIAFANRSFREKFGEPDGRPCHEVRFGKKEPCEFCESFKVLETGKPHRWEVRSPDGSMVIDAFNFPFTDTDGSPLILEMDLDITEQRLADQRIKEERKRLEDVLETLPAYVCLLTPDYRMPFANRVFRDLFGYDPHGKCYEFLFNRKEPCEVCETYKVLKTGERQHWHWTGPNNRDYEVFDFPFRDSDGTGLILEMGIDVTEQNRAQEGLRSASQYSRSLIEASLDPLVTISPDGKISDVNEATIKITGVPREELIGTDFADYFTEPKKARKGYREVFAKGSVKDYPLTVLHRDGRMTDVLYNATVYKDSEGNIIGVFAAARDITEKKAAEKELEKHRLHLEEMVVQRTEELAESNVRLKRSNENLEQFAYIASHDLQEPLRIMASYSELLDRRYKTKLDKDADEFIKYIVDSSRHMQKLITDILAYSRIGGAGTVVEAVDFSSIVDKVILRMKAEVEKNRAVITHGKLPKLMANESSIDQLFQNLIGNAIKFRSEQPPKINISAEKHRGEWHFSVQDNGIGIEEKFKEKVFQIFQRLHGRDKYSGTGIGLSICKKIVETHGGRIWVESEPSKGCTFHFTFPAIEKKELR